MRAATPSRQGTLRRPVIGGCFAVFSLGIAPLSSVAERAIEEQAVIDATLDQARDAWTTREGKTLSGVLANLQERFAKGAQDGSEWMAPVEGDARGRGQAGAGAEVAAGYCGASPAWRTRPARPDRSASTPRSSAMKASAAGDSWRSRR